MNDIDVKEESTQIIKLDQIGNKKKLKVNSLTGFIYQLVHVVCGLILPRIILKYFGSNVNGLVNSIVSLLSFITLLEMGVGAVIQSSLYNPIAKKNDVEISKIYSAGRVFFQKIGTIFICLVVLMSFIYPLTVIDEFDYIFTLILFASISISMLAEYFFGITNELLIKADQKIYVINITNIVTSIANLILCIILVKCNPSIQIIKLTSSIIFCVKPLFYSFYVKRNYKITLINRKDNKLPNQWDGVAQHIATYVLENTDIVVLTVFASLLDISVYSVYYLIANNLSFFINSLTGGNQSLYGNIWACNNHKKLNDIYQKLSFLHINLVSICFSIAIITIVPFVLLYTKGVTDVNYEQYAFGILLLIGQLLFCLRKNLLYLMLGANKIKQMRWDSIIEAVINIVVSICLVYKYGLIGVAIGTIIALLFRVIYLTIYINKDIIKSSLKFHIKQYLIAIIMITFSVIATYTIKVTINNYIEWIVFAVLCSLVVGIISIVLNSILNKKFIIYYLKKIFKKKRI